MGPKLIDGGIAIDDRGIVRFANDFDFQAHGIRRMYWLENHEVGFVRAWHGHEREAKYVVVVSGAAMVGIVPLEAFRGRDIDLNTSLNNSGLTILREDGTIWWLPLNKCRFVLSAHKPQVLYIPPGYANGTKVLTPNTQVMHFSTSTVEESMGDDLRWPWDFLGEEIWEVEQR